MIEELIQLSVETWRGTPPAVRTTLMLALALRLLVGAGRALADDAIRDADPYREAREREEARRAHRVR